MRGCDERKQIEPRVRHGPWERHVFGIGARHARLLARNPIFFWPGSSFVPGESRVKGPERDCAMSLHFLAIANRSEQGFDLLRVFQIIGKTRLLSTVATCHWICTRTISNGSSKNEWTTIECKIVVIYCKLISYKRPQALKQIPFVWRCIVAAFE